MRAVFLSELGEQDVYEIIGDQLHHLLNVIRLEIQEEVMLLDGKGQRILTVAQNISKRSVLLKKMRTESITRKYFIDLALGIPKKDALESCLKQSVELGIRKIFLIRSHYSQTRLPDIERIQGLLTNALEQSNAAYLPELMMTDWEHLPFGDYQACFLLDSQTKDASPRILAPSSMKPSLLVIGPEGGFSTQELSSLYQKEGLVALHLPTPILRTPTAISVGMGMILQSFP
jgi:16S rRNA (uracil1498-N3)-methyltransferase